MGNNFTTILTLGAVGVGGYLFITQVWPMIKRGIQDIGDDLGSSLRPDDDREERMIPPLIVEDRIPDYVVEDRYPDIVVEDRYPDFYNVPYYPVITPPRCPSGKFWNGFECKKVSCGPGLKWDDGRCRPDCPNGWRWDDGRCKPRNCDDDEYFDGRTCRKRPDRDRDRRYKDWDWNRDNDRPRPKPGSRDWKKESNKKRDSDREKRWNNGNSRDKWHADRDVEEKVKDAIDRDKTPEADRVADIQEKALKNFIEIWEV